MSLRIANNLVRTLIFLLSVQFLLPVVAQADADFTNSSTKSFIQTQEKTLFSLSLYLKETSSEEETETEKSYSSAELIDFGCLQNFYIHSHSFILHRSYKIEPHGESLYTVICVFLIWFNLVWRLQSEVSLPGVCLSGYILILSLIILKF
jgi:hypothetical protein